MNLKILIPTEVLLDEPVEKVTTESEYGSFGLLPQHVDFVAALVPGILSFESASGGETFVAIDNGILVKSGENVFVSTRRTIRDRSLERLEKTIDAEFRRLDDREKKARSATAKLEAGFARQIASQGGQKRAT